LKPGQAKVPKEAFISHASGNRAFVEKLCRELHRHGVSYWYSTRHIRGAQQWHDEIGEALRRCDSFILILSPQSVKSKWVKHELLFALNNSRYQRRIIPCVLKKCDINQLSWTLSSYQFVDFTQSFEQGMRALLKVWSLAYRRSGTPASAARLKSKPR